MLSNWSVVHFQKLQGTIRVATAAAACDSDQNSPIPVKATDCRLLSAQLRLLFCSAMALTEWLHGRLYPSR